LVDIVDSATRSRMMANIRGKDTKPELLLRKAMHARGFRFRLHDKRLPGSPDLIFPRYGAVVFVHGCFWHRHEGCRFATTPATRPDFWAEKFQANVARDRKYEAVLLAANWRVAIVWECDVKRFVDNAADSLANWLKTEQSTTTGSDLTRKTAQETRNAVCRSV
jgi:DNA mismatch endonuclease, patch repair protein